MGSYCHLILDGYPVESDKNYVNPYILSLFDRDDLHIFEREINEKNPLAWAINGDEDGIEQAAVLTSKVFIIRERLEVLGFTKARSKEEFTRVKSEQIDSWTQSQSQYGHLSKELSDLTSKKIKLIQSSSFEEYILACHYIISNKLIEAGELSENDDGIKQLAAHILDDRTGFTNYPYWDLRNFLRAIVEDLEDDAPVTYDISDVVWDEIHEGTEANELYDELISNEELDFEDRIGERTLILTEGSSDTAILKRSLRLLYPHLFQYYSFLDFETSFIQGGSGALSNTVKAFNGAGLKNRIIALYDNDTAGHAAIKALKKLKLPNNFRILSYPDLKFAEAYPTIGPNGLTPLNINGLACSIELYLGLDVIMNHEGTTPIQWTGFDKSMSRYQGEIKDKILLQDKFFEKLQECERNRTAIQNYDWDALRLILNSLFRAFNNSTV